MQYTIKLEGQIEALSRAEAWKKAEELAQSLEGKPGVVKYSFGVFSVSDKKEGD